MTTTVVVIIIHCMKLGYSRGSHWRSARVEMGRLQNQYQVWCRPKWRCLSCAALVPIRPDPFVSHKVARTPTTSYIHPCLLDYFYSFLTRLRVITKRPSLASLKFPFSTTGTLKSLLVEILKPPFLNSSFMTLLIASLLTWLQWKNSSPSWNFPARSLEPATIGYRFGLS